MSDKVQPVFILNGDSSRTKGREAQKNNIEAAKLYQQFFVEDGYYRYYESSAQGTQIMRVIPVQRTLQPDQRILDSEEAHRIIDAVQHISLVPCPCRTRTERSGCRVRSIQGPATGHSTCSPRLALKRFPFWLRR